MRNRGKKFKFKTTEQLDGFSSQNKNEENAGWTRINNAQTYEAFKIFKIFRGMDGTLMKIIKDVYKNKNENDPNSFGIDNASLSTEDKKTMSNIKNDLAEWCINNFGNSLSINTITLTCIEKVHYLIEEIMSIKYEDNILEKNSNIELKIKRLQESATDISGLLMKLELIQKRFLTNV